MNKLSKETVLKIIKMLDKQINVVNKRNIIDTQTKKGLIEYYLSIGKELGQIELRDHLQSFIETKEKNNLKTI